MQWGVFLVSAPAAAALLAVQVASAQVTQYFQISPECALSGLSLRAGTDDAQAAALGYAAGKATETAGGSKWLRRSRIRVPATSICSTTSCRRRARLRFLRGPRRRERHRAGPRCAAHESHGSRFRPREHTLTVGDGTLPASPGPFTVKLLAWSDGAYSDEDGSTPVIAGWPPSTTSA